MPRGDDPAAAAPVEDEGDESDEEETTGDAGEDPNHTTAGGFEGAAPRKRRRRRRRRGRGGAATAATSPQDMSAVSNGSARSSQGNAPPDRHPTPSNEPSAREAPRRDPAPPPFDPAFASLTAGLFSHIDDREMPCRVDGCKKTWTWTAAEQIQAFGHPAPRRMCIAHQEQAGAIADRELECSNPWCQRTWTWTRQAQLATARGKAGNIEPPSRVCDACVREERELGDTEVTCRVDGCARTWTWSRDAQLRHRAWLRHHNENRPAQESPAGEEGGRRRGRRRGRGRALEGPPPRMCEPCRQRQARLVDREATCKVHGCTRTVTIDREWQLRTWASLRTTDVDAEAPLPKRMCEVCREFCRLHPDREVACGRPGCDENWTYKTGAQLQAFLAGRFEDPIRLCESCMRGGMGAVEERDVPDGVEVMPCVITGCDGAWHYSPGMRIAPCDDGDQPPDRMCARCRAERGIPERDGTIDGAHVVDPSPSSVDVPAS